MKKKVVVIGGGIAGMEVSGYLSAMGFDVDLLEEQDKLGGHLLKWEKLFPTMRKGNEVLDFLNQGIKDKVNVKTGIKITQIEHRDERFVVKSADGHLFFGDALVIATGYQTFDARKKEEYGYGIYDNVITSEELETMLTEGKEIRTAHGKKPARLAFAHCVGSRDEKSGNIYCSKVCCVTAVKQAIEIKERFPSSDVFCFYMDLRMYGMRFEELYKEAQEKWNVRFIRGRLSEVAENIDGSLVIKAEDTLLGKPVKMNVDMLVLMVGFVPSKGTKELGRMLGLETNPYGFLKSADEHTMTNISNIPGVFLAGTTTAPRTITNTISDARAAAAAVASYLNKYHLEKRTQF